MDLRPSRRCSIVVISGNFISEIDTVMAVIKDVSEDTNTMPLAIFLMEGPDPEQDMIFDVSTRSHNSPLMVRLGVN